MPSLELSDFRNIIREQGNAEKWKYKDVSEAILANLGVGWNSWLTKYEQQNILNSQMKNTVEGMIINRLPE